MKNKFSIALSLALMLTLVVTSMAFASTSAPTLQTATPTIASDLADYAPGQTVNLFGAGWQAGESVHIFVNDDFGDARVGRLLGERFDFETASRACPLRTRSS